MVAQTASDSYFARTTLLSRYQMPGVIPVGDVIRILNEARVRFVLVGAYGLAESAQGIAKNGSRRHGRGGQESCGRAALRTFEHWGNSS